MVILVKSFKRGYTTQDTRNPTKRKKGENSQNEHQTIRRTNHPYPNRLQTVAHKSHVRERPRHRLPLPPPHGQGQMERSKSLHEQASPNPQRRHISSQNDRNRAFRPSQINPNRPPKKILHHHAPRAKNSQHAT